MPNIVTKMLLDDKEYNSKLDKAKKSTQGYQSQVESMGKAIGGSMVKAFGAFGAAVGLAGGAIEGFNKAIQSSQVTADAWDKVIRAAKTSVDTFFTALSTGDFSTFLGGLNTIIERAAMASAALDALGNATMSYGYFTTRNQADFAEAVTIMRDQDASYSDKMAAKATADAILGDQREITEELKKKITTALQAVMTERNYLTADQIGTIDLAHMLSIDITAGGEAERARLEAEYQEYLAEIAKIKKPEARQIYMGGTMNGTAMYRWENPTQAQMDDYRAQLTAVADKYKEAVLYQSTLVAPSDEWLQNVINMANEMDRADKLLTDMVKQYNKAANIKPEVVEEPRTLSPLPGPSKLETADVAANIPQKLPQLNLDEANRGLDTLNTNTLTATDSLDAMATVMSSLGSFIDDSSDSWLAWGANVLRAVDQAIPAVQTLIGTEAKEATTKAAGAVAGGAKSVASIPYVGAAMAVAAAASIAAAIAAAPKFASGGVVGGDSFTGDNVLARVNSQEMVLTKEQQNILSDRIDAGLNGKVEFIIRGQQLVGVLNNYNRTTSRNVNIG